MIISRSMSRVRCRIGRHRPGTAPTTTALGRARQLRHTARGGMTGDSGRRIGLVSVPRGQVSRAAAVNACGR
jgi:hypothetical protein